MDTESHATGAPHGSGPTKQSERLQVSSGRLLVIDQFMLANDQFLSRLPEPSGADTAAWLEQGEQQIRAAAHRFGGCVLGVSPSDWAVFRQPHDQLFVIAPYSGDMNGDGFDEELLAECRGNAAPIARVFIDTRCVVFVDASLLADREFLAEYRRVRDEGNDKRARDLLRERGAAVRYGFNREGDELGVFSLDGGRQYALWPDVVEEIVSAGEGFAGDPDVI